MTSLLQTHLPSRRTTFPGWRVNLLPSPSEEMGETRVWQAIEDTILIISKTACDAWCPRVCGGRYLARLGVPTRRSPGHLVCSVQRQRFRVCLGLRSKVISIPCPSSELTKSPSCYRMISEPVS